MEQRHIELLEKNRDKVLSTVDIDAVLPYFQATNQVTTADVISIGAQPNKATKIGKFLDILCDSTSPQVFHTLCTALESTYPHLLTTMFLGASDGKKLIHRPPPPPPTTQVSHGGSSSHSSLSHSGHSSHSGQPSHSSQPSHPNNHSHSHSRGSNGSSSNNPPPYDGHVKSRSSGSTSRSNSTASKDSCGNVPLTPDIEERPRLPPPSLPSAPIPAHRPPKMAPHPQIPETPPPLPPHHTRPPPSSSSAFSRPRPYARPVSLHECNMPPTENSSLIKAELYSSLTENSHASLDSSSSVSVPYSSSHSSEKPLTHNIDWLKTQCDLAMKELQTMKRQLGETVKKCDHAVKEADMHRHNYYKAREKADQLKGDNASLKAQLTEAIEDKQRVASEVIELQKVHQEDVLEMTQLRKQHRDALSQSGGFEGFSAMYDTAVGRYESLQRECDSLRKQLSESAAQHHTVVRSLESAREERDKEEDKERATLRKHVHSLSQENSDLKKETHSLHKECHEHKHRMSQAVSDKLRISKDIARIRGERDAVVHEYTLVMSERDTVHKEIEQLQDTLNSVREQQEKAEKDKKAAQDELQALQEQMNATRQQHNCTLKELDSIKRRSSPFLAAQDDRSSLLELDPRDSFGGSFQRIDGKEVEGLRKEVERLQTELTDALKEVDDVKRGRDWAFSERDKIVRERESMRALCDKLRHERDSNVNKLIEALRDLDEVKKQKQDGQRDLKEVKEKYDALVEKAARKSQLNCLSPNHSRDSAIDADLQEWEVETLVLSLAGIDPDDLGFDLVGGRGDPQLPSDSDVFIGAVRQGSCAYGKLRTNDQVIRVNTLEVITGVDKRAAYQAVRTGAVSKETVSVVVRRKKLASSRAVIPVHINLSADRDLGLNLENGLYVSRILPGSAAAKEGSLAIGDRIIGVNGNSIEPLSAAEVMRMAQESGDHVTFNVLRSCPTPASSIVTSIRMLNGGSPEAASISPRSSTWMSPEYPLPPMNSLKASQTDSLDLTSEAKPKVTPPRRSNVMARRERDARSKSGHPVMTDSSLDHSTEEEVIDELNSIINQFAKPEETVKVSRPKKRLRHYENGTWPKCRVHTDYTSPVGFLPVKNPRDRPRLPEFMSEKKKDPPTPPERTDSFKRSASIKYNPRATESNHKPESSCPDKYKPYTNTVEPVDYSVKSGNHNDLMKHVRSGGGSRPNSAPGRSKNERYMLATSQDQTSTSEYLPQKPESLDIQPVYASRSPPSKPSFSPDSKNNERMAQSYPLPAYVQPPLGRGPPFPPPGSSHMTNSLPPVAPISMHSPNYSSPPSNGYPSSSAGLSLDASITEMDSDGPHRKDGFSTPSPCPSQQSSSTPLDHSTQSGSEDFPYTTFQPRTPRNHGRGPALSIVESPQTLDGCSTFPNRANRGHYGQERIRIPSTPSVISSKSSVDGVSERGSPISPYMPSSCSLDYQVAMGASHSLPKAASSQRKYRHPSIGETRNIKVEKSIEPLGIQIESGSRGGIFVSSVSEHSLASRNGISIGDQLLEVCGINIRNATRLQAASVLRQMGGSINMLVQYNPDKFQDGSSSSESSSDGAPRGHHVSNETLTPDTISPQTLSPTHSSKGSVLPSMIPEESSPPVDQQRYVVLKKPHGGHDSIGVSIIGGNAVGIFVHKVQPNSSAAAAKGLRCGDQILEWNGVSFRLLTAEQAMNEIAKPAESVSVLAHYNYTKYSKMIEQSGDAFYVRAMFERRSEGDGELSFGRDSVLFVNATLHQDRVGIWRAWLLDEEGNKVCCGSIPSKARLEDELSLKRSLSEPGDDDLKSSRRSSGSARRSFFRKRKHHRNNSKDSRDFGSFSDASINSDCVPFLDDGSVLTFERVDRVDCTLARPVLILGPLSEALINKLCAESPDRYSRCKPEIVKASLVSLETGHQNSTYIDFKARSDGQFECISVHCVREVMDNNYHCMLTIRPEALEMLHKHKIYPITLFIKHKNARQIREVRDTRFLPDKMSTKSAKEVFDQYQDLEHKHKRIFSDVIPGDNLAAMFHRIKVAIEKEQKKALYMPSCLPL